MSKHRIPMRPERPCDRVYQWEPSMRTTPRRESTMLDCEPRMTQGRPAAASQYQSRWLRNRSNTDWRQIQSEVFDPKCRVRKNTTMVSLLYLERKLTHITFYLKLRWYKLLFYNIWIMANGKLVFSVVWMAKQENWASGFLLLITFLRFCQQSWII